MSQIHCYLPNDIESELRVRARARKLPLSKYVAEILKKEVRKGWPEGWVDRVYGGWTDQIERPSQGRYEKRKAL